MYKIVFSANKDLYRIYGPINAVIKETEMGTKEDRSALFDSIREAIENVSVFAYPCQEKKPVTVEIKVYKKLIEATITDKGCGIKDVHKARQTAFTTASDHSGLGFTIMESNVSKVTVSSVVGFGTKVSLTKIFEEE